MTTQRRNQLLVRGGSRVTLALGQKDIYGHVGITLCALVVIFVVQLLSHVWLFVTPWTAARQDSLSCPVSSSLLKLMSIETMMPSNHLILCHPPSTLALMVFCSELSLHIRWPKYYLILPWPSTLYRTDSCMFPVKTVMTLVRAMSYLYPKFQAQSSKQSKCCIKWSENESRSVVSNSLQPHGLYSPWNSPGQNTGVGSFSLLQGIFPTQGLDWVDLTQGSNQGLSHCRQILYQLSHKGSPSVAQLTWN